MFTICLKSYEMCSFILDGHHTMESIFYDFRSTNDLNIYQYFLQIVARNVTLNFIESILLRTILCVYGGLIVSSLTLQKSHKELSFILYLTSICGKNSHYYFVLEVSK